MCDDTCGKVGVSVKSPNESKSTRSQHASSGLDAEAVAKIREFWSARESGSSRKILAGATLAFAEFGYHGASTRAIANLAGMSPASVYIHFPTKEDLFHRIALESHVLSTGAFNDAAKLGSDPASKLRIGIASFAAFNAEWGLLSRTVEYEMRLHRTDRFADIWAMRREVNLHLKSILVAGVEQGQFQIADPEWMKILLLSTCIDVARWYRSSSQTTPEAIGFQYADLAMTLVKAS